MNIFEFAGQHPVVAVISIVLLTHMPVALLRAWNVRLHIKEQFKDD